jgi:hypothetical protein
MEVDLPVDQFGYHPLTMSFYDPEIRAKFKEFVLNSPSCAIQFAVTSTLSTLSFLHLTLCSMYFDPSIVSPFTGPHRFLWTAFYIICHTVSSLCFISYAFEYSVDRLAERWEKPTIIKIAAWVRTYYGALNSLPAGICMCLRSLVRCPNASSAFTMMYCNCSRMGDIPIDHYFFLVTVPLIIHVQIATEWYAPFACWAIGLFFLLISIWLSADRSTLLWSYWPIPSFLSVVLLTAYCLILLIHYSIHTKLMLKFIVQMQKQKSVALAQARNLHILHAMHSGATYNSDLSGHTSCDSSSMLSSDEWTSHEEDADGSIATLSTHAS